jgi:hypothetical protein
MKYKVRKIFIYSGLTLVTLISGGLVGGYLVNPELAACATVSFSNSLMKGLLCRLITGKNFLRKDFY